MNNKNQIFIYLLITSLLLLDFIATIKLKISLAGYWSDRILFWVWFLFTIYIIRTFWKNKWIKRYLYALGILVILSLIPMAIPFFGLISSTTGQGLHYNKRISDKYRLEIVNYGFMGAPKLNVNEYKGILEKEISNSLNQGINTNDSTYFNPSEIENVDFIRENDSILFLKVYSKDLVGEVELKKNSVN